MVDISSLAKLQAGVSRRVSSYDRTGGNKDYAIIAAGRTWMTMASSAHPAEELLPRKVVPRMCWDGELLPSVEAPIGDFFGMGHGVTRNYTSACLTTSPEDGRAFNCFFPMPFASGARLEVENQADSAVKLYYYVDYVERAVDDSLLRFHAQCCGERPAGAD